jgi:hypothetical protein
MLGFPCKISGAGILNFHILVDSDLAQEEDKKIFEMDYGFGFNPIYVKHCLDFFLCIFSSISS